VYSWTEFRRTWGQVERIPDNLSIQPVSLV